MQYLTIKTSDVLLGHHFSCDSITSFLPFPALKKAVYVVWMQVISGLMSVLVLSTGATHVLAADLNVSGSAKQAPLKTSANADLIRTLGLSRKNADIDGSTRIIVGLRVAFVPEGGLSAAAAAQQRKEIAIMQSAVLDQVPTLKQRPDQIKKFETSPFMALEVNAAELEALASLVEVASIEEDRLAAPIFTNELAVPERK